MVNKVKDVEWLSNKLTTLHKEQLSYLHILSKAILSVKYNGQYVTHGRVYRVGGLFDIEEVKDPEDIEYSVTEMALSFNGPDHNKLIRYHNKLTWLIIYYYRLRRELVKTQQSKTAGDELNGD